MNREKHKIRVFEELFFDVSTSEYNANMFYLYLKLKKKGIIINWNYQSLNAITGVPINSIKKYTDILFKKKFISETFGNLNLHKEEKVCSGEYFLKLELYRNLKFDRFKAIIFSKLIKQNTDQQKWMAEKRTQYQTLTDKKVYLENQKVYKSLTSKEWKELKKLNKKYSFDKGTVCSMVFNSSRQLAYLFKKSRKFIEDNLLLAHKFGYIYLKENLKLLKNNISAKQAIFYSKYHHQKYRLRLDLNKEHYNKCKVFLHQGIIINYEDDLSYIKTNVMKYIN
jgi:hypothetical protein